MGTLLVARTSCPLGEKRWQMGRSCVTHYFPMGYRFSLASSGVVACATLLASLLFVTLPGSASAFWDGFPFTPNLNRPADSEMSPLVVDRLCERQDRLGGRLARPLIDPDICNPPPPPEEPMVSISADPLTIEEGESSLLEWNSEHADSCEASDGWSGDKGLSGSQEVSPLVTTTFTITCEGEGGSDSDSVTVTVTPAPEVPTLDFSANPMTIDEGDSSTLSWDSEHADTCTASDGWTGAKAIDGDEEVSPTTTIMYTLMCEGEGGMVSKSVTVTVTPAPEMPTITLVKVLPNDDGGTAVADDFTAMIDGVEVTWGEAHPVTVGAHTVSESGGPAGYTASDWGTDCAADGAITLAAGENKTCTITNDDQPGMLTVKKIVVRDDGDETATTTFAFQVNGGDPVGFDEDGEVTIEVPAGTHTVTEVAVEGFTTSYEGCEEFTIANGGEATCTITNDDVTPEPEPTLSFNASPLIVHEGSLSDATTTLTWDSTDAVSCAASGAAEWTDDRAADGSEVVTPTADTTYELDCTGPGGTVHAEVFVDFVPIEEPEDSLLITEVLYDIATTTQGTETNDEWVEIYNGTDSEMDLSGYSLVDNGGSDVFPEGTLLPAGSFLVVVGTSTTPDLWNFPEGTVVFATSDSDIGGNGLANGGDKVELRDASDALVDSVSWGSNTDAFDPSVPVVATEGSSVARVSNTVDTDTAADWEENESPNPGE